MGGGFGRTVSNNKKNTASSSCHAPSGRLQLDVMRFLHSPSKAITTTAYNNSTTTVAVSSDRAWQPARLHTTFYGTSKTLQVYIYIYIYIIWHSCASAPPLQNARSIDNTGRSFAPKTDRILNYVCFALPPAHEFKLFLFRDSRRGRSRHGGSETESHSD
jgi:hypothetical protein